MWDKERENLGAYNKFYSLWINPFEVFEVIRQGAFKLKSSDGDLLPIPVNGKYLKKLYT